MPPFVTARAIAASVGSVKRIGSDDSFDKLSGTESAGVSLRKAELDAKKRERIMGVTSSTVLGDHAGRSADAGLVTRTAVTPVSKSGLAPFYMQ